jgi:general secretion pathway protein K
MIFAHPHLLTMRTLRHQRGVAVITALLLTTLAITIVASLFWQQQVQVRSIENQRLQSQKEWILRGALDWGRLILVEDARHSAQTHLGEPWATPLESTKLDQYVENGHGDNDASDASLSGNIEDAQGRFNLANLCVAGAINAREVAAFGRLLTNLNLSPALAQNTVGLMASAQHLAEGAEKDAHRPMNLTRAEDLLAVPGFDAAILAKLRDFVIVLPGPTRLNVNTASAEVLSAKIATLSLSEAAAFVVARRQAYVKDISGDLINRLAAHAQSIQQNELDVRSDYFLVNGNVQLGRAALQVQSLIYRTTQTATVIWTHEN